MWEAYSKEFIRKNRATVLSVLAAAFISSLFLALLCCLFYNFWNYEIESLVLEEGDWQGRISGVPEESRVSEIENFANVKAAAVNQNLSGPDDFVIDIWFQDMRTVYQDMPQIAEHLGIPESAVSYHEVLLSKYFIHDPRDTDPPLLLGFYAAVLVLVSISLILIIHNTFALSMNARIRQLGIISSIGATPGQIKFCLFREAAVLCILPVLFGILAGTALSFAAIQLVNRLAAGIPGRHEAAFTCHPVVWVISLLAAFLTVLFSAWLPAWKLSRLGPLDAIQNTGELRLKRKKKAGILSLLFGAEGELAANALKAQKKALRTSSLSLTLSFLGFTLMLCFFTLSEISTNHTYFERYQNVWDVYITVKNIGIEELMETVDFSELENTDCAVYQKAEAFCSVPEDSISNELKMLGTEETVAENLVRYSEGFYSVPAPVIILDDSSFAAYCRSIGAETGKTGSIILNRVWDSVNSNFRYKDYIPFLSEDQETIVLQNAEQTGAVEIPVLAYTQEPPVLKEEYENYALVQFVSLSAWKQMESVIGNAGTDTYLRILSEDGRELSDLQRIETQISAMLGCRYEYEMENRVQEKADNDEMMKGYKMIVGALCVLLALIGIANVFSNTLSFIRQRKREFARYLSIGMTPAGMRKMFCIEAFVIAGRPVLLTLLLTALAAGYMIRASYLDPKEFLAAAPVAPITVFILAIFGCVALAYYLGAKKIMKCSLTEVLRSDWMI